MSSHIWGECPTENCKEHPKPSRPTHMRLGYHRVSDNSISSAWLPVAEFDQRNEELKKSRDIDHVWARDEYMNLIWERWQ